MNRRKLAAIAISVVAMAGAAAALVWHFRPEPPPTTAHQVYGAVMTEEDPLKMSPAELDRWVNEIADTVERLPPHEMQKLLELALQDEEMRKRFESLKPETRRRLMELVSEEQRVRLGAEVAQDMVLILKAMPRSLRNKAIREMHERGKRDRERAGREGHDHEFTKERFAQFHAASTPRQRAQFVRAMRDLRKMLEEAGVND